VEILLENGAKPEVCSKDGNPVNVVIENSFCQWGSNTDRHPFEITGCHEINPIGKAKEKAVCSRRHFMRSGDNGQNILSITERRSFDPFSDCAIGRSTGPHLDPSEIADRGYLS
jgi:hypothetical protein